LHAALLLAGRPAPESTVRSDLRALAKAGLIDITFDRAALNSSSASGAGAKEKQGDSTATSGGSGLLADGVWLKFRILDMLLMEVAVSTLPSCQRRSLHSAIAMQLAVGIGLPLPAVDEANVTRLQMHPQRSFSEVAERTCSEARSPTGEAVPGGTAIGTAFVSLREVLFGRVGNSRGQRRLYLLLLHHLSQALETDRAITVACLAGVDRVREWGCAELRRLWTSFTSVCGIRKKIRDDDAQWEGWDDVSLLEGVPWLQGVHWAVVTSCRVPMPMSFCPAVMFAGPGSLPKQPPGLTSFVKAPRSISISCVPVAELESLTSNSRNSSPHRHTHSPVGGKTGDSNVSEGKNEVTVVPSWENNGTDPFGATGGEKIVEENVMNIAMSEFEGGSSLDRLKSENVPGSSKATMNFQNSSVSELSYYRVVCTRKNEPHAILSSFFFSATSVIPISD
jgi:hypothetical protein